MDIWEPCNYVSNLAYDRLLVEICVQQACLWILLVCDESSPSIVLQGWSLPPKVVTKIAESFAILTFGSSFMHGRFDNIFLYIFLSCDNDIFLTATRGLERSKMSEATISSLMSSTRWTGTIVTNKPDFMSLHIISFWKWVWPISTIISQSQTRQQLATLSTTQSSTTSLSNREHSLLKKLLILGLTCENQMLILGQYSLQKFMHSTSSREHFHFPPNSYGGSPIHQVQQQTSFRVASDNKEHEPSFCPKKLWGNHWVGFVLNLSDLPLFLAALL